MYDVVVEFTEYKIMDNKCKVKGELNQKKKKKTPDKNNIGMLNFKEKGLLTNLSKNTEKWSKKIKSTKWKAPIQ